MISCICILGRIFLTSAVEREYNFPLVVWKKSLLLKYHISFLTMLTQGHLNPRLGKLLPSSSMECLLLLLTDFWNQNFQASGMQGYGKRQKKNILGVTRGNNECSYSYLYHSIPGPVNPDQQWFRAYFRWTLLRSSGLSSPNWYFSCALLLYISTKPTASRWYGT